jgi:hypothetical protein
MPNTLIWGTANPEGLANSYNGVYLNKEDITSMVSQVRTANNIGEPIPVHLEHKGVQLGHVVSAWEHNGTLQCVLELNERVLEGSISKEFVRSGIVKDLSLGYSVDMQQSKKEGIKTNNKILREISMVKQGAQRHCHIHAFTKQ